MPHRLPTEQRNPASLDLDRMSPIELVTLFNREDARAVQAVKNALPAIARAVEIISTTMEADGRWFMMGAGTSGRLAVLDAVELRPTFNLPPGVVIPLLAGGEIAMTGSVEDAEDDAELGASDLRAYGFGPADVLLGVAASGYTPYVLGGLAYARHVGARSISFACNPDSPMAAAADLAIEVITGPEVLTGSTRLKAGTAQKLVLNMISTSVMVHLGKVYGNLMVDVRPTNSKLRGRATRIVSDITELSPEAAEQLLVSTDWDVKTAVVMALANVDAAEARQRLAVVRGHVRKALSPQKNEGTEL
jgi:N-acetylmuramic acid 6-phosphate etherase